MKYCVVVLPRAEVQLYQAGLWWAENRSADEAGRWLAGFEATIKSLASYPEKQGAAREDALGDFPFTIRQLLYGLGGRPTHRAIFEIRDATVYIHAIRHLAQADITPDDI